jgi:hypothetical protein
MVRRLMMVALILLAAGSACAESLTPDAARRFVAGKLMMEPAKAAGASLPRIEVVRVKRIDPSVPQLLRFQLSEGSVDLMKAFSVGGSEGIGGVWKIPSHTALPGTFDARWGEW